MNSVAVQAADRLLLAQAVAALMSEGRTLTTACQMLGLTVSQVLGWKRSDAQVAAALLAAEEAQAEIWADSLLTLHERHHNPHIAKIEGENVRWLLGKRRPDRYGDKVTVQGEQSSLVDVLREAIARIPRPASDQPLTIDAEAVEFPQVSGPHPTDS